MIKVEMIMIEITEVNKLMLLMRIMMLLLLMKGAGITRRVIADDGVIWHW